MTGLLCRPRHRSGGRHIPVRGNCLFGPDVPAVGFVLSLLTCWLVPRSFLGRIDRVFRMSFSDRSDRTVNCAGRRCAESGRGCDSHGPGWPTFTCFMRPPFVAIAGLRAHLSCLRCEIPAASMRPSLSGARTSKGPHDLPALRRSRRQEPSPSAPGRSARDGETGGMGRIARGLRMTSTPAGATPVNRRARPTRSRAARFISGRASCWSKASRSTRSSTLCRAAACRRRKRTSWRAECCPGLASRWSCTSGCRGRRSSPSPTTPNMR